MGGHVLQRGPDAGEVVDRGQVASDAEMPVPEWQVVHSRRIGSAWGDSSASAQWTSWQVMQFPCDVSAGSPLVETSPSRTQKPAAPLVASPSPGLVQASLIGLSRFGIRSAMPFL
jgi:hypothetical protein